MLLFGRRIIIDVRRYFLALYGVALGIEKLWSLLTAASKPSNVHDEIAPFSFM